MIDPQRRTVASVVSHSISTERGSGECTYSELFCDKILSRPIRFETLNLLLSNALLAAHAHIAGPA